MIGGHVTLHEQRSVKISGANMKAPPAFAPFRWLPVLIHCEHAAACGNTDKRGLECAILFR